MRDALVHHVVLNNFVEKYSVVVIFCEDADSIVSDSASLDFDDDVGGLARAEERESIHRK